MLGGFFGGDNMTNEEKMLRLIQGLADKKVKEEAIKTEYKEKIKVKALTTAERLERLEKLAGL